VAAEGLMTANKHFKRRVRERARRTGESYTAALSHLRRLDAQERPMQWQRIEKPDFGYAVHVPDGWAERPPNLKNSPWETARFHQPDDRRHSVVVFRSPSRRGGDARQVAEHAQAALEHGGFTDFALSEVEMAGRTGALLECAKHDAGRVWAVREYFVTYGEAVSFCLGCGTAVPEEDAALFTEMAERFELLEPN
jgi:hypothetical protein